MVLMFLQPVRTPTPAARMVTATPLRPQSPISTAAPTLPSPSPQPVKVTTPSLPTPPLHVRPQLQQQQQPQMPVTQTTKAPTTVQVKPLATPVHVKTAAVKTSTVAKPPAPSLLTKPTAKEKEKKSFSSAGYT